jgi:small subunit ribosomal protein S20
MFLRRLHSLAFKVILDIYNCYPTTYLEGVITLPQRRSAIKELRKNHTNHMHNLDIKTDLKKTIKKFLASVQANNVEEAQENLKVVYKKIDKAAKRNLIHENTAARRKSRYSRIIKTMTAA